LLLIEESSLRHRGLLDMVRARRPRRIPQTLEKRIQLRLTVLDQITDIAQLPPNYRAHELTGNRRGHWSVWVSGPWRMTFRFRDETVFDLDLEQYH
jgi:proteic killer suppression protein